MIGPIRCVPIAFLHWIDDIQVGRFLFANYDYDNAIFYSVLQFSFRFVWFWNALRKSLCSFNLQSLLIYWRCWDKYGNFSFRNIPFGKCKSCKTQYCLNIANMILKKILRQLILSYWILHGEILDLRILWGNFLISWNHFSWR